MQSALQTGEFFADTFHTVLYRFWNYRVKNTTSGKMGFSSHNEKLISYVLGLTFHYSYSSNSDYLDTDDKILKLSKEIWIHSTYPDPVSLRSILIVIPSTSRFPEWQLLLKISVYKFYALIIVTRFSENYKLPNSFLLYISAIMLLTVSYFPRYFSERKDPQFIFVPCGDRSDLTLI